MNMLLTLLGFNRPNRCFARLDPAGRCQAFKQCKQPPVGDSWVDIEDGELLVKGMHISPYDHGNLFNQDPMRVRRLLAHKSEIRRLHQQCKLQGYTLVPLSLYFKHGRVKMEVGLCKGKKLYDKRADAAQRDAKRSIDRAVKSNGKYY